MALSVKHDWTQCNGRHSIDGRRSGNTFPDASLPVDTSLGSNNNVNRFDPSLLEIANLWRIDISTGKQPSDMDWGVLSESERSRANRFVRDQDRSQFVLAHAALRQIIGSYHNIHPESIQFTLGKYGKPHLNCPDRPYPAHQQPAEKPHSSTCHGVSDTSSSGTPSSPPETGSGLWQWTPLEFSLSHSGNWALVALGTNPIGIDVEQVRQVDSLDSMISRICTPREQQLLRQMTSERQLEEFFRIWTAKEAILKGIGFGLGIDPSLVDIPVSGGELWRPVSLTEGGQHTKWHLQQFAVDEYHTVAIAISEAAMDLRVGTWGE